MNICLTTWGYPTPYSKSLNGISIYTAITAKKMAELGHNVTVVTSHAEGMPVYFSEYGYEVFIARPGDIHWYLSKFHIFSRKFISVIKIWEIGKALIRKVAELDFNKNFDIVEVGPPAVAFYSFLRKPEKFSTVTTIHGMNPDAGGKNFNNLSVSDWFIQNAEKYSAINSKILVAPSRFVSDLYQQKFNIRPIVIPLPVDSIPFIERDEDIIKIITLAGIGEGKGAKVVIEAIKQISPSIKKVHFLIVAGKFNKDFNESFTDEEKNEYVELLPWLKHDELINLFTDSHIFISASPFETFGLAIAEAMSAGMVVLASNIPTHRELLGNNERGMLFEKENPMSLAQSLEDIIANYKYLKNFGKEAQLWTRDALNPTYVTEQRIHLYMNNQNG